MRVLVLHNVHSKSTSLCLRLQVHTRTSRKIVEVTVRHAVGNAIFMLLHLFICLIYSRSPCAPPTCTHMQLHGGVGCSILLHTGTEDGRAFEWHDQPS